jgi:hypothetical protein
LLLRLKLVLSSRPTEAARGRMRTARGLPLRADDLGALHGSLEFQLPAVFSKRRPDVATAIQVQMAGRIALGNVGSCASLFFLLERIFCIDGAALMSLIQASGLVPTWLRGGAALEMSIAGGKQGSDCIAAIFVRVCFAFFRGLIVKNILLDLLVFSPTS